MRIIDEKGRLFGRINIIDFIVLLFLFSLLPLGYYGYKLYNERKTPSADPSRQSVEIEIPCKLVKVYPDMLKLISVGDKLLDYKGEGVGSITWIGEPEPYKHKINMEKENTILLEDFNLKELPAKIKLLCGIKNDGAYYQDHQVYVDFPLEVKTEKYTVEIVPLPRKELFQKQWVKLKVKFSALPPEMNNTIKEGDIETNEKGETVARLVSIINNTPSQIPVVSIEEKKLVIINDISRNDLMVLLDVLCYKKDGKLFFKNYDVKVGSQINFSPSLYIIYGMIVAIEEKNV